MQLTREFFDGLIVIVIVVGLVLAAIRLRADFTRPLPPEPDWQPFNDDEDTRPNKPIE